LVANGSTEAVRCPVCSAELSAEPGAAAEGGPSGGSERGAQARPDRARSPSMVATDEEPRRGPDQAWERMVHGMTPVPWDERDRTAIARALDTILQLTLQPDRFFRAMATDRDGGVLRLALTAVFFASFGISWILTGVIVAGGTTVSPVWVALEVTVATMVVLFALGGFRAAVTGLMLRLRGERRRGVRRVAAFSAAPLLLGLVPVIGLLVGLALGTRAYATGLRVRFGLSAPLAWMLAMAPGPVLLVAGVLVLAALSGA
jgi:hypothetical protein